ncbi:Desmethyl-deoxy-podophyllotoxin synthase [Linum perenne]
MEEAWYNLFTSNPILTTTILFLTILTVQFIRTKTTSFNATPSQPPLPPGPWKLPIIGNLHQLMGTNRLLHRRLADLAGRYGPLMHLKLGETSNVIVSSPELAKEFMKTHDLNFATRPYLPSADVVFYNARDIAFGAYGEYWRQMRKICTLELLSGSRVKMLRPVREEEIGEMVKSIRGGIQGETVNLSQTLISLGYAIISRAAFGYRMKKLEEEALLPVLTKIVVVIGGSTVGDFFPSNRLLRIVTGTERQLKRLHREVDIILEKIIDEHIEKRRARSKKDDDDEDEDLVDVLLSFTEKRDVEIKAVILVSFHVSQDIFLAGSDTSSTLVEWVMSELMKNPLVMQKAQKEVRQLFDEQGKVDESRLDELHYLQLIIKETFRLHPIAPLFLPRECRETVVVNGYLIPEKTRVTINAWAIGRDPRHWTNPDEFIPERFVDSSLDYKGHDFQFLPFGSGRRVCPGIQFGIAVVELLLANLLYHFDWKLPGEMKPRDLDMDEVFGSTVGRKNDLILVPIPYYPK